MVSRFRTFQVYFGGVFTHVSVDLEEGDITKSRASDFEYCQGLGSRDQLCELHHFMHMYNYFLKARVSLRTLSSPVINLFTQVAIVLELALVSSQMLHILTTIHTLLITMHHVRPPC